MIAQQTHHRVITTKTVLPFFRNPVQEIAAFIEARLATCEGKQWERPITFDINFLSFADSMHSMPEEWANQSIYPIKIYFSTILLGPLYRATDSHGACPCCLERRWLANRHEKEQVARKKIGTMCVVGRHTKIHSAALEILWSLVSVHISEVSEDGNAWFYSLDLDTLEIQRHQLMADSSCPVCARPAEDVADADAWQLHERRKPDPSLYRLVAPLDYSLPETAYLDPLSGILGAASQLEIRHTITAPVSGMYCLARKSDNLMNVIMWGGHTTRFETSRRVGMLEGLERYSGQWARSKRTTIHDTYTNLSPDALDPRSCGLYDPDVYCTAKGLAPFDPDRAINWLWGYSLRTARPVLVPEQLAYYFGETKNCIVYDTSSGCAIGSCLEEAMFHALMEVIERDNFLIHWYAQLAAPRLNPWSVKSVKTLHLLDRIERLGYDLHLLDVRLDTCVPTVVSVAIRRKNELGKLVLAAGASFDPEEAIRAAVSEMAAAIPGMTERMQPRLDEIKEMAQDYSKVVTIDDHVSLFGLPEMARYADFLLQNPHHADIEEAYSSWNERKPANNDLRADLQYVTDIMLQLGLDVIAVDQTAPELAGSNLKVVRVIVPGLIPMSFGWNRHRVFQLARMITVPRTAGYLKTDFDLTRVNLTPHPFP